MATNTPERRSFARAPLRASAILATGRGDISAEIVDISVGGLGVRVSSPVLPGEFVRVRVRLPTDGGPRWFDPDAVVSRVEQAAGIPNAGLRLVNPPPSLHDALAAQVSAHVNRPSSPPAPARRSAAPVTSTPRPLESPTAKRRELAQLYRSALESVADEKKRKKRR